MPAEGVNVYNDPWDKADLEGFAMLFDRIPDTNERTYRGVTCQRWLVRFQEDQEPTPRWIDYGDAVPWIQPLFNTINFQLDRPPHQFTAASQLAGLYWNDSSTYTPPYAGATTIVVPHACRLRSWAAHLYISNVANGPPNPYFRFDSNAFASYYYEILGSAGAPVHLYPYEDLLEGHNMAAGDMISVMHFCACTGAQTLSDQNVTLALILQWGDFT